MTSGKKWLYIVLLTCFQLNMWAQEKYCSNLGFELKDFSNWRAYTWVDKQDGTYTSPVEGVVANRHQIITTQAYDAAVGGSKLKMIPDGFTSSVKLGSTYLGSGGLHQSLRYELDVTEHNALVIMHFAVLLLDPFDSSHGQVDEPRFKLTILDNAGNTIPDCANYDVYASNARVGDWQKTPYTTQSGSSSHVDTLFWRDWTAVGVDLRKYLGQKVSIEFMSANCRRQGHFGYAYFTAECKPLYITVDYCTGDSYAELKAPGGFEVYEWKDSNNTILSNQQTLSLQNPSEGEVFTCDLKSATGCEISLNTTIYRFEPNAHFSTDRLDCNDVNNTIRFFVNQLPTHGTLEYSWDFGDGGTSTDSQPVHQFKSVSGWVPVTLVVKNPPSSRKDSVTQLVETFYPPLVNVRGEKTYCKGEKTMLYGYGADHYEWKLNGALISTADTVYIGAPGGQLELTGYTSQNECSTTKSVTVSEEPDWNFSATQNAYFCKGGNVTLSAQGAVKYSWSSLSDTTNTITVNKAGTYTVTGLNLRGCSKSIDIQVSEIEPPLADFSVTPEIIDGKHNQVACFVPQQNGVQYYWDFGDGEKDSLVNSITHAYTQPTVNVDKIITLKAVNNYGCENSSSKAIQVGPYFPNVFTPNSDGINDRFLLSIDVQIVDRNGNLVYKGNEGWNGKINNTGANLPPDTYYYTASYADSNGVHKLKRGYVTLIRTRR